ncbi:MAG TPA: 30S ribosome-binding factor RbfA [Pirellulales bacterium]
MSSRRLLKAAAAVREVVGLSILADLKDPRIRDVTVTHVEISPDMRHAKVHVSVMGNETQQQLSLRGLQSAAGFLQAKIAERIETRYTPRLMFVLDQGVKKSIEMARILKQVLPPGEEHDEVIAASGEVPAIEPTEAPNDAESETAEIDSQGKRRPR